MPVRRALLAAVLSCALPVAVSAQETSVALADALTLWVGDYAGTPFERLKAEKTAGLAPETVAALKWRTLFDAAPVERAILDAAGLETLVLMRDVYIVQPVIERQGAIVTVNGCMPHDCRSNQYSASFDTATGATRVCVSAETFWRNTPQTLRVAEYATGQPRRQRTIVIDETDVVAPCF